MRTAFILEDEPGHMETFTKLLKSLSFIVETAVNVTEANSALKMFVKNGVYPDICIFDQKIDAHPEISGLAIARKFLSVHRMPVIICTVYREIESEHLKILEELQSLGIPKQYYVSKSLITESGRGHSTLKELIIEAITDFKTEQSLNLNKFGIPGDYDGEYKFIEYCSIVYLKSGIDSECFLFFTNNEDGKEALIEKKFGTNIGDIGPQISLRYLPFIKVHI